MISFILSLIALVLGYFIYGKFVEKVFGPDDRPTPAVAKADGVDFIAMPNWKVFMVQFLNIAGTGPIFGAILGAKFGPVAYLWIVFGCIFAGAVHDYMCGMLSIRHGGANLPDLVGVYLGNKTKNVMLVFSVLLLMMVGVVFVYSPAEILTHIWEPKAISNFLGHNTFWIALIQHLLFLRRSINTRNIFKQLRQSRLIHAISIDDGAHIPDKYTCIPEIISVLYILLGCCQIGLFPKRIHSEDFFIPYRT